MALSDTERPAQWKQVVGQDRALRLLHALLRKPEHMTHGFIFHGPWAVGKTTSAYLFARALMCEGSNPLGCNECPSCRLALESIDAHPAFTEVDAAYFSGVGAARDLLARLDGPAPLGRRRVVLIDEAHNLTKEASDVFLKPLELKDPSVVFIFASSAGEDILHTIQSRCTSIPFSRVSQDALTGLLISIADRKGYPYYLGGLSAIAKCAQGRPRDAVKTLGLVSAVGPITPELVEDVVNQDANTIAEKVFSTLTGGDLQAAVALAEELSGRVGPVRVIEAFFSHYSQAVLTQGAYSASFAPLKEMVRFFVKWSASRHLPSDVIPLFILELSEMQTSSFQQPEVEKASLRTHFGQIPTGQNASATTPAKPADDRPLTAIELKSLLEEQF